MTHFMSRLQVHDFDDRGRHSTCANGSTVQSYGNRGRYSAPYLMYRNGIWTMKQTFSRLSKINSKIALQFRKEGKKGGRRHSYHVIRVEFKNGCFCFLMEFFLRSFQNKISMYYACIVQQLFLFSIPTARVELISFQKQSNVILFLRKVAVGIGTCLTTGPMVDFIICINCQSHQGSKKLF